MTVTFHALSDIAAADWLVLVNHPEVIRHMPLASDGWTEAAIADWARGKDAQWQQHGYGPWAIRIDGAFAGWGGFQKEDHGADLALVLFPQHWGRGIGIFRELLRRRAGLGIDRVSILLPPSRTRLRGLARLGFAPDGEVDYDGRRFLRFRLESPLPGGAAGAG